ncbi:helix-turn-helix transcriptional regulator [Chitinophaga oryzae]|uniref:Helix-turn-helix transcriptional regulator n=2 Tax=Chitinophaga TaxID=79328 RepID=A0ABX6LQU1_9BACT|nr:MULTISPECIES: helix-turn-helix transcriptional regulator [Chitinophaga]MBC9909836.1 helix-turn-helix transcriptional regulator [Chitinophaga varians]QJB42437.1 helix-turn-helix transcriptional regulator [Chitinophaga oryzae]TWF39607.1 DNA-binding XRE family transcriptional regulator [Chitinophaga polysaccharea]
MTFGEKVTIARKQKKLTQTELADATGTSRDIIGKYERDESKPSIEIAARIAEVLDSSLDFLIRDINREDALAEKIKQLSPINREYVMAVIEAFEAKEKLQGKR